mmetsp:Transcript_11670/g.47147  ORF Transcript_11670/g.47147 Transcript_11670/m.47147 type:complete len:515 (+) Transcript_11670:218-1762(+)
MSTTPYIGSRISLISKNDARYEGILYGIDTKESEVYLQNVLCFGTEDRVVDNPIPASQEVFRYIIFRGSDIKDLHVCEPPAPAVPSPEEQMMYMQQQGGWDYQQQQAQPGYGRQYMQPPQQMYNPYAGYGGQYMQPPQQMGYGGQPQQQQQQPGVPSEQQPQQAQQAQQGQQPQQQQASQQQQERPQQPQQAQQQQQQQQQQQVSATQQQASAGFTFGKAAASGLAGEAQRPAPAMEASCSFGSPAASESAIFSPVPAAPTGTLFSFGSPATATAAAPMGTTTFSFGSPAAKGSLFGGSHAQQAAGGFRISCPEDKAFLTPTESPARSKSPCSELASALCADTAVLEPTASALPFGAPAPSSIRASSGPFAAPPPIASEKAATDSQEGPVGGRRAEDGGPLAALPASDKESSADDWATALRGEPAAVGKEPPFPESAGAAVAAPPPFDFASPLRASDEMSILAALPPPASRAAVVAAPSSSDDSSRDNASSSDEEASDSERAAEPAPWPGDAQG